MAEFTRFAETITVKEDMRVVSITVQPIVSDCTGRIWFTDLMVQEGDRLTGFVINTGDAICADVLALIGEVQRIVKEKTGFILEPEVRVTGEN